jgi:hypothetical protein
MNLIAEHCKFNASLTAQMRQPPAIGNRRVGRSCEKK